MGTHPLARTDFDALLDTIYAAATDVTKWPEALRRIDEALESAASSDLELEHTDASAAIGDGTVTGTLDVVVQLHARRLAHVRHAGCGFVPEHFQLYQRLAPHIERAIELNRKLLGLETRSLGFTETLNCLAHGVLLVDERARVLFANRMADSLLGSGRGLRVNGGVLCAGTSTETAQLHSALSSRAACGRPSAHAATLSISQPDMKPPLALLIAPIGAYRSALPDPAAVAMVFVADPTTSPAPGIEHMRMQFNLTKAEATFAAEILRGDGIGAAAERLSISRATARTHLARLFEKTGTRRQAELVRVLMSVGFPVRLE